MGTVSHDRVPAAGRRGVRIEEPLIHVAERGMRRHAASAQLTGEPVVVEPHVVADLVRHDDAATVKDRERESAGKDGYSTEAWGFAHDQVHKVGPNSVPEGVHVVHVTIFRVNETI